MFGAGQVFGKQQVLRRIDRQVLDGQVSFADFQGRFDRIGQARAESALFVFIVFGFCSTRRSTTASMVWIL